MTSYPADIKRIVIAAPHSGSGKTTVTLGIMAALRRRGLTVAPFKVGPDFIDPGYHALATGATSINLDGWMCGADFVRATFAHHTTCADIAVIEGVMGLFDGIDGSSDAGSSAEIAKLLDAPVLLVVDARSQARSAAALVHGFTTFDPEVRIGGVVFNNVASPNHERLLREAMAASHPEIPLVGCLPKDPSLHIPSRHLGLLTADENPLSDYFFGHLASMVEKYLDMDRLLALSSADLTGVNFSSPPSPVRQPLLPEGGGWVGGTLSAIAAESPLPGPPPSGEGMLVGVEELAGEGTCAGEAEVGDAKSRVRIAVARDAAFCFVYGDNLRLLRAEGAELCFFSPLADDAIPDGISGIYLPGGYPELFAERLSGNDSMKESLRRAAEDGMPIYAECGGFIYLTRGVEVDQALHPFVGIFPVQTTMLPRRKALGYRQVELLEDGLIGGKGTVARGHEFHYSEMGEMPPHVERLYAVTRKGTDMGHEGFCYKNCLVSYIHLHFGSSPGIAERFVGQCREYMTRSLT
ncbi:cobyrinate a,c-diamide synthase [Geomonas sp.]|uniref:cobyrinate a,c-diamide synthase n=1 Tax=Geomonas sp. TaxID=2651584 RepID=UPI002B46681C|nr:cobyrinate a,c-diamide synthase [Geomonas sp.]HJV36757.1 cobyrinate a,c-diamide synthase [Geomonas sp.]